VLVDDPIAKELLRSTIPARLAYGWRDGTPRVVPIWFHWDGTDLVMGTPGRAPKLAALRTGDRVAVSIDTQTWPYHVLLLRGAVDVRATVGLPEEYRLAALRYFGEEQGRAWIEGLPADLPAARVAVRPDWARVLDFETRFPSAFSAG
jgi:hypothetical protein